MNLTHWRGRLSITMKKNKKIYHALRFITMILTTLMIPLGTYVGFQFGAGHYQFGLVVLAAQCAITFVQTYIWWVTLEYEGKIKR